VPLSVIIVAPDDTIWLRERYKGELLPTTKKIPLQRLKDLLCAAILHGHLATRTELTVAGYIRIEIINEKELHAHADRMGWKDPTK
jgi:hypothetical protein